MRAPRTLVRAAAAWLLPWALWAALPAVRWCALDWDQVALESFVRCSVSAGAASAACELETRPAAHEGCEAAASGCAPSEGCPFEAACEPRTESAAGAREDASQARAFCVAGPNGGVATHASAPGIGSAPEPFVAPEGFTACERAAAVPESRVAEVRWRPPTAPWSRSQPVRGPPRSV